MFKNPGYLEMKKIAVFAAVLILLTMTACSGSIGPAKSTTTVSENDDTEITTTTTASQTTTLTPSTTVVPRTITPTTAVPSTTEILTTAPTTIEDVSTTTASQTTTVSTSTEHVSKETIPTESTTDETSEEFENPFVNPGKWYVSAQTEHAHGDSDWMYLGNNEKLTVTITSKQKCLSEEDFFVIYDENYLKGELSFINPDASGETIIRYSFWHIATGHSEIDVLSWYEYLELGEDVELYTIDVYGMNSTDGRIVYITPTGEKYHYSKECAGENAMGTTIKDAKDYEYEPCGKCVK